MRTAGPHTPFNGQTLVAAVIDMLAGQVVLEAGLSQ